MTQNDKPKPTLSYSQITTFLNCRKKWYWLYIENLAPKQKSHALKVGDLLHRLLDAYYRGTLKTETIHHLIEKATKLYPNEPPEAVEEAALQAAQLLNGYIQHFEHDDLKVTSPEVWLEKDFGDFALTARLDAVCQTPDGRKWRMEHKTTSRLDSAYLRGQRRGLQTGIALWLADELMPGELQGTVYNIIIKKQVPEYHRELVPRSQWLIDHAKQCVEGVVRSIQRGDFYPSLQCFTYNQPCDYEPLCRNDTPATREALYINRKEVVDLERITL